jgi:hypothetical protein
MTSFSKSLRTLILSFDLEKASPQLFRIHSAQLVLLQTYCLPEEAEYSGSGQLGFPDWTFGVDGLRKDDCVVMCANKGISFKAFSTAYVDITSRRHYIYLGS